MGPGVVSVRCTSTPTAESITAVWNDGRVGTYRGIKEGTVKYSATVFGDPGVSTAGIYGHGLPVNGVVPTNDKYVGAGDWLLQRYHRSRFVVHDGSPGVRCRSDGVRKFRTAVPNCEIIS